MTSPDDPDFSGPRLIDPDEIAFSSVDLGMPTHEDPPPRRTTLKKAPVTPPIDTEPDDHASGKRPFAMPYEPVPTVLRVALVPAVVLGGLGVFFGGIRAAVSLLPGGGDWRPFVTMLVLGVSLLVGAALLYQKRTRWVLVVAQVLTAGVCGASVIISPPGELGGIVLAGIVVLVITAASVAGVVATLDPGVREWMAAPFYPEYEENSP